MASGRYTNNLKKVEKMSDEKNNKIKIAIIIIALILSVILLIGSTLAIFSAEAQDIVQANVGKIGVILVEDYPETDEFGAEIATKYVRGLSVEDKKAYVRISYVPVVEFYDQETNEQGVEEWVWKTAAIDESKIKVTCTGEDFIEKDGYWYYKNILQPYEETTNLKMEWEILELPLELTEYTLRTNIKVILEYSQTTNSVWKNIFNIDSLPEGVEQ